MSLDSDIALLARVKLFEGFNPDHLRLLAFGAEARTLGQGTRVYRQGSLSDGGYVIVRGNVDLISGLNDSIIASHGPGSLIGEMALITSTEHAASAIATEHTEVLKLPRPLFRRMLSEYPELAGLLHGRISNSVAEFMTRLETIRGKLEHASDLERRRARDRAEGVSLT